jgi:hypothetical protein
MLNGHFLPRHTLIRCAAAIALGLLGGGTAALAATAGENLLVNPHFDTSLSGWLPVGLASWDSTLDTNGSSSSGSAKGLFDNATDGLTQGIISQCVPVSFGTTYLVGGDVFIPAGQRIPGSGSYSVAFFAAGDCSGRPFGGPFTTPPVTAAGTWTNSSLRLTNTYAPFAMITAELTPIDRESFQVNFDEALFTPVATTCASDLYTLCLEGGLFQVTAVYDVGDGVTHKAQAGPIGNSGYLWFFSSDNAEAMVKMIDACSLGGNYWFFAAGLTNLHVVITATDTVTGAIRIYSNPANTAFQPVQDTAAFPCL